MASSQCVLKWGGDSSDLFGFEEIINNIYEAIEKPDSAAKSNIAIIGEPFSGRTKLLNKISDLCKERESKISFSSLVSDEIFLRTVEKSGDIVLVDNCQLLYSRKIGGFEKLNLFLNTVITSNKLFITTWNQFSWNYLRFIYPLERIFPTLIELPRLGPEEIKEMIIAAYGTEMVFTEEVEKIKEQWLVLSELSVDLKFFRRSIKIPVPRIDYFALRSHFLEKFRSSEQRDETSAEDKVFQRLKDASEGNPGIAKTIWEKSVNKAEGTMRPGDIIKPQYKINLNYDQAFLLYIILCMESISIEELKELIDPNANVNQFAYDLEKTGLIFIENGLIKIMPEALHSIESYVKSFRQVL